MVQSRATPIGPLRAVLSKLRRTPESSAPPEIQPLLARVREEYPKADLTDVVRAWRVAEEMHAGQTRKSGEPFVTHPLGVAMILAGMGMDPTSIVAALLHDAVEDTDASLEDLRESFGDEVAEIIDGLTKISKVRFVSLEHARAENYRKMTVAMARDVRVIIVKLADRLHNMRTLAALPPEKQELKALETLEIYVPLASRLGMQQLKVELEDLAFRYRYPKRHQEVVDLVERRQPERDRYVAAVLEELSGHLEKAKIRAEVGGRAKNYFSVYQKMVDRGREFDDILDLVGVRIVVDDVTDCYTALGVVHTLWVPIPGRFKDYIAQPKANGYQSLHTTVMGPQGKSLEIQIRTHAMHRMSEYGIAAHWRYKSGMRAPDGADVPWLGEVVESFREDRDPREFMESLRLELFHDEVFCFTPKGDVECLPRGATPVDFAYQIHTQVGHRCVGARVNGKLVPLDTHLESGDAIEILTSKAVDAGPKQDWLGFVKTSRARSRIKQWIAAHRREEARDAGKDAFVKLLRREGLSLGAIDDDAWRTLLSETRTSGPDTLYEAIGENKVSSDTLRTLLRRIFRTEEIELEPPPAPVPLPKKRKRSDDATGVVVVGVDDVAVKLSRCCAPVPGDDIFGYVTRGKGVSVHRADCPNAASLRSQTGRLVEVAWDTTQRATFVVTLQMAALDRPGLLRDVTQTLTDSGVMILSSQSWAKRDGTARLRYAFELGDVAHLDHIVRAVGGIEGVFDIYRVLPLRARDVQA